MREISKLYEDYVRGVRPLFEPVEAEYNSAICEETFELCVEDNAFGPLQDMPAILADQDIRFDFDSPLQAAQERAKSQAFQAAGQHLLMAAQLDPSAMREVDVPKALRAAILGEGAPADWLRTEEESAELREADQKAQMAGELAGAVQTGGQVAQDVGAGAQQLQQAGLV